MLQSLYVENIAILKQISVEFSDGFTVLTGETGAGKSILIDSIGMVLGAKTKKELVGPFATFGLVKAQFTVFSDTIERILQENDILCTDELFIERKITKDGRSTAKINSVQVPLSLLQQLAPHLINIHGQHDNILMLNPACHIEYLDRYAGLETAISEYRKEYDLLRRLRKELSDLQEKNKLRDAELDRLSFKLGEYERVNPYIGMMDFLQDRRKLLQNQKSITDFLQSMQISEDKRITDLVSDALRRAEKLCQIDERFKSIYTQLDRIQELADSVLLEAEDVASEFEDSQSLLEIEDKIYELQQLLTRYGPTEEDLLLDYERTQTEFDRINALEDSISVCKEHFSEQFAVVQALAGDISKQRQVAAKKLAKYIGEELSYLDMKGVTFEIYVSENLKASGGRVYNDRGFNKVEFLIATNAGQAPKPLHKIASGGELSRIMLSLTNVLSRPGEVGTMIFDEIDTGVSGKTAEKIGHKLLSVSKDCQVFSITHLAQIASMGSVHLKISKQTCNGHTETSIEPLVGESRVSEISRIIGGITITDTVLNTAREMLAQNNNI